MKLNTEQQAKFEAVRASVERVQATHERFRKRLEQAVVVDQAALLLAVREAVEAGVPKRQVQFASGIKGTSQFYDLLRSAGVVVAPRPEFEKVIVLGSVGPKVAGKVNVLEGLPKRSLVTGLEVSE